MSTTTYSVVGMTCDHCVRSVTEEVTEVPGVTGVEVDLATGRLTVAGTATGADITAAVTGQIDVRGLVPSEAA